MRRAAPSWPWTATVWSIPPVGAPTTSVSARTAASTMSSCGPPSRATPTAHSSAADEDSPAPTGTVLSTSTSNPPRSWPASRSVQSTPAAYPAQPSTEPSWSSVPSKTESCWALATRTSSSARGRSAAYVAWGSATGRTSPRL